MTSLTKIPWSSIRQDVLNLVREKGCGPILVRLAWHDAGTYCKNSKTGGPRGCMRFATGEAEDGANAGLAIARNLLQPIHTKYPEVGVADFWAFSACCAVEAMGGPKIPFAAGRSDAKSAEESVAPGRLPDATQGASHLRDVFYRMGFNDGEIVALSGAHTVGECHKDRSGFVGPWTHDKLKFDNTYFKELLDEKWEKTEKNPGFPQFKNPKDDIMMLISDLALIEDPSFKPYVEKYAQDQNEFFKDYAVAFKKLVELGYNALTPVEV